jgi:alpha-beta hydrolase superfamily lysophospholipase
MGRVQIGTCTGPADAALVRAVFEAHQIPVLINAEQHASMLGGLGGAFVPLHILVDDEYAEEAAGLLSDLREHDRTTAAEAETAADPADDEADDELDAVAAARADRRHRIGVMMVVSLGGAVALPFVVDQPLVGVVLGVVFVGLIASAWRRPSARSPLPQARVTSEKK